MGLTNTTLMQIEQVDIERLRPDSGNQRALGYYDKPGTQEGA